ncbi:DUF3806 domain-containing protein [bacterium]|nr:DUF3806 domain-containing protein [bacterium]
MEFSPLKAADIDLMERQRALIGIEARRFGWRDLPGGSCARADLLQLLIDGRVFRRDQKFELQALGVIFGDVLCAEGPFAWVVIEDEYGRDPTVRFKKTSICVHAMTLISKRIEADEDVDVHALLDELLARCEALEREGAQ